MHWKCSIWTIPAVCLLIPMMSIGQAAGSLVPTPPQRATLGPGPMNRHTQPEVVRKEEKPILPGENYTTPFVVKPDEAIIHDHREALKANRREIRPLQAQLAQFPLNAKTKAYHTARQYLRNVVAGTEPISVLGAVCAVERAWYADNYSCDEFRRKIQTLATAVHADASRSQNPPGSGSLHQSLLRLFSKGLESDGRKLLPYGYDFDDPFGRTKWPHMFVSKLLSTHKGQCHSLPLLYLILAEQLNLECSLAYGPQHIYVLYHDEQGQKVNLELTNGRLATDAFLFGSGMINVETVRSGIYLHPLTDQEFLSLCFLDLAKGYARQLGMDRFVLQTTDEALKIHPTNIFALMFQSDNYTRWFDTEHQTIGKPSLAEATAQHPQLMQIYSARNKFYDLIDATGFRQMSPDQYLHWIHGPHQ